MACVNHDFVPCGACVRRVLGCAPWHLRCCELPHITICGSPALIHRHGSALAPAGPLVKDSGDHLAELKIPLERTEAVDTCLSEFALHHVQAAVYFTAAMQFAESAPSGPEPAIVMEHRAKVFRMLAETDFGEGTPDHRRRDATLEHDFVASLGDSVFCRAFIHDKRLSQAYAMAYMAVEKHDGSELFQVPDAAAVRRLAASRAAIVMRP